MVGHLTHTHPGPARVALPTAIRDAIVSHARAEAPNEACGIVLGSASAADRGKPLRFVPTRNAAASPYRYEIHSDDLFGLWRAAEEANEAFWAIVHSHVASPAIPSPTDLGLAFWPDALYLLVSLAPDEPEREGVEPDIRAWRIVGGSLSAGRMDGTAAFEVALRGASLVRL